MVRIALISDIHANKVALDAVLRDISRVGADRIICLGDVATLGPSPSEVVQILQEINCLCIMGNHDEFLLNRQLVNSYTEIPLIVEAIHWARQQLSSQELHFISTFHSVIQMPTSTPFTIFHGTPGNHMENILATTPASELDEMLMDYQAALMACGHTHIQMLRQHRGNLIINPGSVGAPFKEFVGGAPPTLLDHAEYAYVDITDNGINATLCRIPLDKRVLRSTVAAKLHPMRDWLLEQYG